MVRGSWGAGRAAFGIRSGSTRVTTADATDTLRALATMLGVDPAMRDWRDEHDRADLYRPEAARGAAAAADGAGRARHRSAQRRGGAGRYPRPRGRRARVVRDQAPGRDHGALVSSPVGRTRSPPFDDRRDMGGGDGAPGRASVARRQCAAPPSRSRRTLPSTVVHACSPTPGWASRSDAPSTDTVVVVACDAGDERAVEPGVERTHAHRACTSMRTSSRRSSAKRRRV